MGSSWDCLSTWKSSSVKSSIRRGRTLRWRIWVLLSSYFRVGIRMSRCIRSMNSLSPTPKWYSTRTNQTLVRLSRCRESSKPIRKIISRPMIKPGSCHPTAWRVMRMPSARRSSIIITLYNRKVVMSWKIKLKTSKLIKHNKRQTS